MHRSIAVPENETGRETVTSTLEQRLERIIHLAHSVWDQCEALALERHFLQRKFLDGIDLYAAVRSFEIQMISNALHQTNGNQSRAARLLGVKPTTLQSKIKSYKIKI